MLLAWPSVHVGLLMAVAATAFPAVDAVRQLDLDLEERAALLGPLESLEVECGQTVCAKPLLEDLGENRFGQGLFRVSGPAAREMFGQLRPGWRYSVHNNDGCRNSTWLPDTGASVVQWLDAEDPVNRSFVEVFINPRVELQMRLEGIKVWLCAHEAHESDEEDPAGVPASPQGSRCLCQLSGTERQQQVSVLGHLAALSGYLLGHTSVIAVRIVSMQMGMERQCPFPWVPDMLLAYISLLSTGFWLIVGEALIARRSLIAAGDEQEEHADKQDGQLDDTIILHHPWKTLRKCGTLAFGFVSVIISWQTAAVHMAIAAKVPELFVWVTIIFICVAGLAGIWRFAHVLCRQQLRHALLVNKVVLDEYNSKIRFDGLMLGAVGVYILAFVMCSWQTADDFALWLVGASSMLVGLIIAIFRALDTARVADSDLSKVQMGTERLASLGRPPELAVTSMDNVVRTAREGRDVRRQEDRHSDRRGSDFTILRDIWWHRRLLYQLGQSTTGFYVLPSMALAGALLLAFSAAQATTFACSRGELLDLELASSRYTFSFKPWQDRFQVEVPTNFMEVVLISSADAASAREVTVGLPQGEPQPVPKDKAAHVSRTVPLINAEVPRVATVNIMGPRESQAPTTYKIRFAPMQTVPTVVSISDASESGSFHRCVGWGTLRGAEISIPADVTALNIAVVLTEFVVGVPRAGRAAAGHDEETWTAFSPEEENCEEVCHNDPNCFTSFKGKEGCYFAQHNHEVQEKLCYERSQAAAPRSRFPLVGQLCGCSNATTFASQCCRNLTANRQLLNFSSFVPSWHGNKRARLTLQLALNVDSQLYFSDVRKIHLSREPPVPSDVLVRLEGRTPDDKVRSFDVQGTVQGSGDILLRLPAYNPLELHPDRYLTLFVAPVLPDRAFEVAWSPLPHVENDTGLFTCNQTLLRQRYKVCGGHGRWETQTAAVSFSHWDACPGYKFHVQVSPKALGFPGSWPARSYHIRCDFAQAPAVVAAKKYGCELVSARSNATLAASWKQVAESADALCGLLDVRECARAEATNLCSVLPGGIRSSNYRRRSPERTQLLACAHRWRTCPDLLSPDVCYYTNKSEIACKPRRGGNGKTLRIGLRGFLETLTNMTPRSDEEGKDLTSSLLEEVCIRSLLQRRVVPDAMVDWLVEAAHTGSVSALHTTVHCLRHGGVDLGPILHSKFGYRWKEVNVALKRVVLATWVGLSRAQGDEESRVDFIGTVANLSESIPRELLRKLVVGRLGALLPRALPPFNGVGELAVNLDRVSALHEVSLVLQYAPNLERLRVSCYYCEDRGVRALASHFFSDLHGSLPSLRHLELHSFEFRMEVPTLDRALEALGRHAGALESLTLVHVSLPTGGWSAVRSVGCIHELKVVGVEGDEVEDLAQGLQARSCSQVLTIELHEHIEVLREAISRLPHPLPNVTVREASS